MNAPKKLPETFDMVRCPKCGEQFSKIYARSVNCLSCPEVLNGCKYIRCPKCDHEFEVGGLRRFDNEVVPSYIKEWGMRVV
jgi:uncharacterized C2H2 Zn-finger protein